MLIKSGVGKIRIIDYDHISLSGLSQHASATRADVGASKVIALRKYFKTIAPWAEVDACVERLQDDSAEHLLSGTVLSPGLD
jgi:tRNA A37 threonylcarbamoyladenosine dehydratase